MKNQQGKDRRTYRNRHIVISVLVMIIICFMIVVMFLIMYGGAKQNLLNIWENNVIQLAKSTEYYLARPADAIEFTAANVEDMMAEGRTNLEIGNYLVREMDIVASIVENNTTGVYGYCRGEYLDASGWIPDEDYVPAERPWYVKAKENDGKTALVSPYLNAQTKDMMMSVSKLLSDKESVVAIDIYPDGLQQTLDELSLNQGVRAAFILDSSGCVVAHSNHEEIGKDYLKEGTDYQKRLVEQAVSIAGRAGFYESGSLDGEILLAEKIHDTWMAVLVLNEASLLGPVRYLNVILLLFLIMVFAAWYSISRGIDRKYREAEQLSREVSAVADIYEAMTLVDLKTGKMTILRNDDFLTGLLGGNFSDYGSRISGLAEKMASDESRDMLVQFMNPETYGERLKDVRSISFDFLSGMGRWLRIQLIVVDRDSNGCPVHIIWAVESIDEEHRQQEHLRKLAETDSLSRLRNRRSGEAGVRAMLEEGTHGLFILLDIDNFKSINDNYGHDIGDLVISAVADCLRKTFRDSDIVFRLGGDEFAVFTPGVENTETGDRLVERLCQEIRCISIRELAGVSISASIGTSYNKGEDNTSFEALYQQADQKMYENKKRR